ncbi:Alpha/beta hydrolase family protein [Microbulbifer donghaiensis]|uniref:Alpha/beta hydrolase family protein n=1 Tax=Microbulbifer donghaiensis TaxID=494016 RepID=A0A1M5DTT6_9GAMM|nr:alpha/beta fold hydrolase [Microbulbifer donghaiensis]SHF70360.1 Alpha/beta hydrolase family protein [Microbulbifer donghaiensis]
MTRKLFGTTLIALIGALTVWYLFFALKAEPIPQPQIIAAYDYEPPTDIDMRLEAIGDGKFSFSFRSFDGALVNGQISYPPSRQEKHPVLIGISAMGRGYQRWWTDSFKERPTVTRVNEITELATDRGYAVIAIDARFHGTRKDPDRPLRSIMNDLHFFGDKTDYENMIRKTVLDYRVLLDWISDQPTLDSDRVTAVGYSMGAQVGLLLSALDQRVGQLVAMVPPHIDDKTALVAPKNLASLIDEPRVLLVTANEDEYASAADNRALFLAIASENKEQLAFDSGHILPADYVDALTQWL